MDVAVDMDDVIAEYSLGVEEAIRSRMPDIKPVAMADRKNFYVVDDYPKDLRDRIGGISKAPGFYGNLSVVPGSLKTLQHWKDI